MIAGSGSSINKTGTVSSTAESLVGFGFSAGDVAAADRVIICVTANALRLTWDHPTANLPTGTAGLRLPTNNYPLFILQGRSDIAALQMIRDASSDATVSITLERS